uniref:Uncharacterized protein n=1 Tax=uncultured marine virus TaxID=186617 RepID=A0A0F7L1L4_9VIRU|nr:hypothetical protein [uncultured marine virus]
MVNSLIVWNTTSTHNSFSYDSFTVHYCWCYFVFLVNHSIFSTSSTFWNYCLCFVSKETICS